MGGEFGHPYLYIFINRLLFDMQCYYMSTWLRQHFRSIVLSGKKQMIRRNSTFLIANTRYILQDTSIENLRFHKIGVSEFPSHGFAIGVKFSYKLLWVARNLHFARILFHRTILDSHIASVCLFVCMWLKIHRR